MELCSATFGPGLSVWDTTTPRQLSAQQQDVATAALAELGALSAQAQGLKEPITTLQQLVTSEHRLYVMCDEVTGRTCYGYLRVGVKRLYLTDGAAPLRPRDALCLLDFYVHHRQVWCQRQGMGRRLFNAMLKSENVTAEQLAYDRPSPKLRPFLKRHYGLAQGIDQPNRFMVFPQYFRADASPEC
ncbi:hypothetical protein JKP88DRAFT_299080 [Tribonema minus]|uniref:Alpha-tubulin N-acetyltransferase n=1 Tax=Tribonema minus TaxID=303371 RepID=A0A835Z9U1_9STRA|nr:hypothetical protein JKP88DRAFT_299080 [Tribonema minus]